MVGKDESDPRVLLSDGRKVCEHCRHLGPAAIRGLPETPWVSSLPGRFALHLGYWIKAVLQVTFTVAWEFIWAKGSIFKGAAVAGILITPLYKHCSPWETVSVCYTPALPFLKLLAAPKAVSHVPYNYIGAANSITA